MKSFYCISVIFSITLSSFTWASNKRPLDCGCLKDVIYGTSPYNLSNATGDAVSQSAVLCKLINAGKFIRNIGNMCQGLEGNDPYLKVIQNSYASSFKYQDVFDCVANRVTDAEQMKVALENINTIYNVAFGIPVFDVATTTLISFGTGKLSSFTKAESSASNKKKWIEIGSFVVGLAGSGFKAYQNVGDIFAYLAIQDNQSCQQLYLKKYVREGDVETL